MCLGVFSFVVFVVILSMLSIQNFISSVILVDYGNLKSMFFPQYILFCPSGFIPRPALIFLFLSYKSPKFSLNL